MCQLGDRSGVEAVASALFAGDYDTGRELEPDGSAALREPTLLTTPFAC